VSRPRPTDPLALLDALNAAGVEYVVIGGAAAVLHGAPVTTQDLDIVHRLTPEEIHDAEHRVRVVDLPTLIEIKGGTRRMRDRIVLPILEELLARRRS
jgi:hypothetical protein